MKYRRIRLPKRDKSWKLNRLKKTEASTRKELEDRIDTMKTSLREIKKYPWGLHKLRGLLNLIDGCERAHRLVKDHNRIKGRLSAYKTRQRNKRKKSS